MNTMLAIAYEFFKTGLFAIGGGLATIPFLTAMGEQYGWFTFAELADMIAISESTPGPVGINMATYVGFTASGVLGAAVATIAIVTPSVITICLIAKGMEKFRDNVIVESVLYGIRPAATGMIAAAMFGVLLLCLMDTSLFGTGAAFGDVFHIASILVFALTVAACAYFKKLHPAVFIGIGALLGVILQL